MKIPDQSLTYVARAYLSAVLSCRVIGRDEPLPVSFFDLMQAPQAYEDPYGYYIKLVREVVVPEARRLVDFENTSILRAALGLDTEHALLPFAASLLLLTETRKSEKRNKQENSEQELAPENLLDSAMPAGEIARQFDVCWRSLPERLMRDVKIARIRQLKRLRFQLMPNSALRFLASATLQVSGNVEMELAGWGAKRIGIAGYSHFGREITLFALLEQVFGGGFLNEMEALTDSKEIPIEHDLEDNELDALFNYVLTPISVDLFHLFHKRKFFNPDAASKNDAVVTDVTVDKVVASIYQEEKYIETNDDEDDSPGLGVKGITGNIVERAVVDADKNDASRRSQMLLEADPSVKGLYSAVCDIFKQVETACSSPEKARKEHLVFTDYERVESNLEELFKLWFAFQLLSFLIAKKYTAAAHGELFDELAKIFDKCADPDINNALIVAEQLGRNKKQIFGETFATKRTQFIDSAQASHEPLLIKDMHLDTVQQHLVALKQYSEMIGDIPDLREASAVSVFSVAVWVMETQAEILADGSKVVPGVPAELASLWSTLENFFDSHPYLYLIEGFTALDDVNELIDIPRGTSRNELQGIRSGLRERLDKMNSRDVWAKPQMRRALLVVTLVNELVEICVALPEYDDSTDDGMIYGENREALDIKQVKRFFTMNYAPSQKAGDQYRWLYVAYKVSLTDGFETYRRIFERVSEYVGEWKWMSADDQDEAPDGADNSDEEYTVVKSKKKKPRHLPLAQFYVDILELKEFHECIRKPIEALICHKGESS